jgi:hypothetical protein
MLQKSHVWNPLNQNNSKKEKERRKQCYERECEDEKQWAKLVRRNKTKKVVKWRLAKLSNEDEVAHGWWTMMHNDGIQNFGQNFNFRSKHNCVLK